MERENPEAKIKCQHPQAPPVFAVLDFIFDEGVFPVPLAGVERGVPGAKGCPSAQPRLVGALLATDSGGSPEAGRPLQQTWFKGRQLHLQTVTVL